MKYCVMDYKNSTFAYSQKEGEKGVWTLKRGKMPGTFTSSIGMTAHSELAKELTRYAIHEKSISSSFFNVNNTEKVNPLYSGKKISKLT